jgi:8-amino-7-oxononanoate synthase
VVPSGGYVVIDDTQALGVLGRAASGGGPYGADGGGSLRWQAISSPRMIVGSSLAKAFGVPIAVLGGSARIIRRFEERSETRIHASPPSIAELHAAEHALRANAARGDELRDRLARLVAGFRRRVRGMGLRGPRSLFPVQALGPLRRPSRVQQALQAAGVVTAVVRSCVGREKRLVFVITASHTTADLDHAAAALEAALD